MHHRPSRPGYFSLAEFETHLGGVDAETARAVAVARRLAAPLGRGRRAMPIGAVPRQIDGICLFAHADIAEDLLRPLLQPAAMAICLGLTPGVYAKQAACSRCSTGDASTPSARRGPVKVAG